MKYFLGFNVAAYREASIYIGSIIGKVYEYFLRFNVSTYREAPIYIGSSIG
jgi:hypothetical protein